MSQDASEDGQLHTLGLLERLRDESKSLWSTSSDLYFRVDALLRELSNPNLHDMLAGILPSTPTIVLAHDSAWFAHVPAGPHLTLAGHTHGGQIRLPGVGIITNASKAPLRWSHGLIHEGGRYLYVTSGIGTSGLPLRWGVPPEYGVLDLAGA